MPVEIVDASKPTSPQNATVQKTDLNRMLDEYRNQVMLEPVQPRTVVHKMHRFFFTKDQLLELFSKRTDLNAIEVALCVQKTGASTQCVHLNQTVSMSDNLAVVISLMDKDLRQPATEVGQFVLITDFSEPLPTTSTGGDAVAVAGCCPGST